jgi:hypothetical protein
LEQHLEENMSGEIRQLLAMIDEAYSGTSWHGPNLRGSVRGLTPHEASWRPARGRHSIQEIIVHAGYWKYTVRRKISGLKRGSFALKGSNWFPRPGAATFRSWNDDIALVESEHALLRDAVRRTPREALRRREGKRRVETLIRGIALHDVYHAGQIQLLKRLMGRNRLTTRRI